LVVPGGAEASQTTNGPAHYYPRAAAQKGIEILFGAASDAPAAQNAVKYSVPAFLISMDYDL
jgi:hypothetical protein